MKRHLSAAAAALLCAAPAFASDSPVPQAHDDAHVRAHADAELASMRLEHDPDARVFIVMSRDSHAGMTDLVPRGRAMRDSLGQGLVVAEIRARQLSRVTERIHQRERRCGGYFAFPTRGEAEAFVRSDRSAEVVSGRATARVAYTIDNQATVSPWLNQVQHTNIHATIDHLQTYQNRYYASSYGKAAAEWIRTTWQGLAGNRNDVSSELFSCSNCSTQPSVILTIRGAELPDEIVVLGAHLDSINGSAGGSTSQRAPGADDDASGIATLTEVLRIAMASGWKPRRTVKFMGYAAEEVGLRGSNAIAQAHRNAGANVVGVLQMDMTNYKSASSTIDMRLVSDYSSPETKAFLNNLFDTYLAPRGLRRGSNTCGYGCSDHASWTAAGYPAGFFFEGGTGATSGGYFNQIHTANDTLANMGNSAQNSAKFALIGLAFLGEAAKTASGGGGGNVPPAASFTASVSGLTASFTDTSTDSDGSIASRSWNFGDGATSTATHPGRTYATAGTYTVTLTVTDNAGASNTATRTVSVGGAQTYANGTDVAIVDNATVESAITVSGRTGSAPAATPVAVGILHTYIGDLKVDLVAPDGSVYVLHNRTGGSADNIQQTYTVNLSSEPLNGTWTLRVRDNASQDTGRIDTWSLTF